MRLIAAYSGLLRLVAACCGILAWCLTVLAAGRMPLVGCPLWLIATYCGLLWLIVAYCGLLRLVAACCGLLRRAGLELDGAGGGEDAAGRVPVAAYCDLLRLIAAYCGLLRLIATCCGILAWSLTVLAGVRMPLAGVPWNPLSRAMELKVSSGTHSTWRILYIYIYIYIYIY